MASGGRSSGPATLRASGSLEWREEGVKECVGQ